jgi:hypothetical protein
MDKARIAFAICCLSGEFAIAGSPILQGVARLE